MTAGAGHRGVLAGQRKWRVVVIKRRRNPGRSVMAQVALLRESGLNMVRVGRAVEIIQVAGGAGSAVQVVVAIDVALRTLQRHVSPSEWKTGGRVIESCIRPGHSRMARVASLREPSLGVIGISRALVVL